MEKGEGPRIDASARCGGDDSVGTTFGPAGDHGTRPAGRARRRPVWSGRLTRPIAAHVPLRRRPAALAVIKAAHTAAFAVIAGCIVLFTWDSIRGREGRRVVVTSAIAIGESAIYASNNQVCPLTPLAEELGAESGTVTDLYLPNALSERIPLLGGSLLLIGLVFRVVGRRGL